MLATPSCDGAPVSGRERHYPRILIILDRPEKWPNRRAFTKAGWRAMKKKSKQEKKKLYFISFLFFSLFYPSPHSTATAAVIHKQVVWVPLPRREAGFLMAPPGGRLAPVSLWPSEFLRLCLSLVWLSPPPSPFL